MNDAPHCDSPNCKHAVVGRAKIAHPPPRSVAEQLNKEWFWLCTRHTKLLNQDAAVAPELGIEVDPLGVPA